MYVMSSLPQDQQAVGGGLFQTLTRLSTSIGLGVSTAVYTSVSGTPGVVSSQWHPYRSTFFVGLVTSVLGAALVPFINLQTQGSRKQG